MRRPAVDLLPIIRSDPGIKVETVDPLGTQGVIRFNFKYPPFDNKLVRQAAMWSRPAGRLHVCNHG